VVIALFMAIATYLILASQLIGWVVLAVALCIAFLLKRDRSIHQNCLRLSPEGLELRLPFRRTFASWDEAGEFETRQIGLRKYVTFELSQDYIDRQGAAIRMLAGLFGRRGSIPTVRDYTHEDLASLLNRWRSNYNQNECVG